MKEYQITENNITYSVKQYNCGDKYWYLNEKLHRETGPAVEYADGYVEYFYNGLYIESVNSDFDLKRYIKLLSIS